MYFTAKQQLQLQNKMNKIGKIDYEFRIIHVYKKEEKKTILNVHFHCMHQT